MRQINKKCIDTGIYRYLYLDTSKMYLNTPYKYFFLNESRYCMLYIQKYLDHLYLDTEQYYL